MRHRGFRLPVVALAASLFLSACGFKPLYETRETDNFSSLGNVTLSNVVGSEGAIPYVRDAFDRRTPADASEADYSLFIDVDEIAVRLAVQVDASVTRYNYRLNGKYQLTNRQTGERITGSSQAFASFNVVTSQYSTLFAERSTREKAADMLADQIEQSILLELTERADDAAKVAEKGEAGATPETDDALEEAEPERLDFLPVTEMTPVGRTAPGEQSPWEDGAYDDRTRQDAVIEPLMETTPDTSP